MGRSARGKPTAPDDGVFISYRREDSGGHAGRLYDRLASTFGPDRIFMDVDTLQPGADFVQRIEEAVASCGVLLALIGRRWEDAARPDGQRRLEDPSDFVRHEIAAALRREVVVMPVLLQNAQMPNPDRLPEDLKPLSRHHAIELDDARYNYDVDRLLQAIDRTIRGRRPRRRKRWMLVALAASCVAGAAVVTVVALGGKGGSPAPSPKPVALLREDFSSSTTDWPTRSTAGCGHAFRDGGYQIRVTERYVFCVADTRFSPNLVSLANVRVEADARWVPQIPVGGGHFGAGSLGLRCRAQGDAGTGSSYEAGVSPTGYWQLVRYQNGKQQTLQDGDDPGLFAVRPAPTPRPGTMSPGFQGRAARMALECADGPTPGTVALTLFVDGRRIFRYTDTNALPAGAVGLSVSSFVAGPVEGRFDDVAVFSVPKAT